MVPAILKRPCDQWRQDTELCDTLGSSQHCFVIHHLEWMLFEGDQFTDRDLLYLYQLTVGAAIISLKNIIVTRSTMRQI